MTAQRWLDRTQAITDAATPGPWRSGEYYGSKGHITAPVDDPEEGAFVTHCEECMGYVLNAPNAEWIAHARTALPAAVAALQAVLDLHAPDREWGHICGHCTDFDTYGGEWIDYPCPTVKAITEALGEE